MVTPSPSSPAGVIVGTVDREGRVPFDRYMELALYHPFAGYYRCGGGSPRDYVTAPRISGVFGRLLGRFARQAGEALGGWPLTVLELGSGGGRLAADALAGSALAAEAAEGKVLWVAADPRHAGASPEPGGFVPVAAEGVAAFARLRRGVVVANELFDALPVKVGVVRGGVLREVFVTAKGAALVREEDDPTPELAAWWGQSGYPPVEGACFEYAPGARRLLDDLAGTLEAGVLAVLDYGTGIDGLLARAPLGGTLRAFREQVLLDDPLALPGECDLTADVDFEALARWGEETGWRVVHQGSQLDFLLRLGLLDEVASVAAAGPQRLEEYLAAKRFLLDEGLQERFRVLVLDRGLTGSWFDGD